MQGQAADVDAYLDEIPESRRSTLEAVRDLCRKHLSGYDETIAYGMPCYVRDGKPIVSFASQKNDISLYVNPGVVDAHRAELTDAGIGKSCIRFSKPEKLDLAVIETLIVASRDSAEAGR
jgi:uncharacterized protein YdhG (YjbR/CyaY superfamily)